MGKAVNDLALEKILLDAGLISEDEIEAVNKVKKATGEKVERILLSESKMNYKDHLVTMASKIGVEYIDLENIYVDKSALEKVDSSIARKYSVFPFNIKDNYLCLAMNNPDDIFLIDDIKVFTQMEIKPYLADNKLIDKAISYFYPADRSALASSKVENKQSMVESSREIKTQNNLAGKTIQTSKDVQVVNANISGYRINISIEKEMQLKAPDVFMEYCENEIIFRFKINDSHIK